MIRVPSCKCLNVNWIRLSARGGVGRGWHPSATTASGAMPNGEALVRVVVVGLEFQATEDRVKGAGGRSGRWPSEAVNGIRHWAVAMRGAKELCIGAA
jgi:hypothetical protein